jgi:hypothetical protein
MTTDKTQVNLAEAARELNKAAEDVLYNAHKNRANAPEGMSLVDDEGIIKLCAEFEKMREALQVFWNEYVPEKKAS